MRKFLFISFAILLSSYGFTQRLDQTLLWKVEGNGMRTSYVFGTFHLLPEKDYFLSDEVKEAFSDSELVVMELDMDDPFLQRKMVENASKSNESLDQYLNPEEQNKLEVLLDEYAGVPFEQVNRMKPFMLATMLIPSIIEGTPASYETSLLQLALDQDKEVEGLETVDEKIAIYDAIDYETQVENILDLVNKKTAIKLIFDELVQSYQDQDIEEIFRISKAYLQDKAEVEITIINRNKSWIGKMEEFSKKDRVFYAVGAAHLGGNNGLIRLLKEAGYKVMPVK